MQAYLSSVDSDLLKYHCPGVKTGWGDVYITGWGQPTETEQMSTVRYQVTNHLYIKSLFYMLSLIVIQ